MLLQWAFKKDSQWFVDKDLVPPKHPLFKYISTNTWPDRSTLTEFGDHWHELPLQQLFEVPESVDPSELLDDWRSDGHSDRKKTPRTKYQIGIPKPKYR